MSIEKMLIDDIQAEIHVSFTRPLDITPRLRASVCQGLSPVVYGLSNDHGCRNLSLWNGFILIDCVGSADIAGICNSLLYDP